MLDRLLHVGIQVGADHVAAAGDLLLADAGARQVGLHVIAEESAIARRDAATRKFLGLRQNPQRLRLGGAQRVGLVGEVVDHGVQDEVSTGQRAIGVGVGIQRACRLDQAGQQGRLLPVQVGCVHAEVRLCGILHAEGVVTEGHQVQVAGQDLRFGEGLVQSERHPDFAQFARGRGLDGRTFLCVGLRDHQQLVVLYILLLDRRTTPGVDVARRVACQAGQGALPVHAIVLGEPLVFDRDDRQLHCVGDLVAGHLEPALRVQPSDRVALCVHHRGHRRDLALEELGRSVADDLGGPVGHQPDTTDQGEQQGGDDDTGEQAAPGELGDGDRSRGALRHGY